MAWQMPYAKSAAHTVILMQLKVWLLCINKLEVVSGPFLPDIQIIWANIFWITNLRYFLCHFPKRGNSSLEFGTVYITECYGFLKSFSLHTECSRVRAVIFSGSASCWEVTVNSARPGNPHPSKEIFAFLMCGLLIIIHCHVALQEVQIGEILQWWRKF